MSSKYICPLCGKVYYNVDSLAECTARDAKAIRSKENKLREEKERKESLQKSLQNVKSDIDILVGQLRNKVNDYNTIGRKLISIDPKTDAHCSFNITFSSNDRITSSKNTGDLTLDELIDKFIF